MANYRKSIRVPVSKAAFVAQGLSKMPGYDPTKSQRLVGKRWVTMDMRETIKNKRGTVHGISVPPTLDMPNIELRSVRQIYKDLKNKKKLASKNSVPVKTDQATRRKIYEDARKRINGEKLAKLSPNMTTDQYVSALLIRVRGLETRVTDLELAKESKPQPYTQDLDKKVPVHAISNDAANRVYKVEESLQAALTELGKIRHLKS